LLLVVGYAMSVVREAVSVVKCSSKLFCRLFFLCYFFLASSNGFRQTQNRFAAIRAAIRARLMAYMVRLTLHAL